MSKSDSAVDYAATGLSAAQVRARAAAGKRNVLPPRGGKSFWNIVRTNVFTRINAILGVLFLMVISTGSWINSAFGLLIIVNSVIGAVQEFRARRTLASLSIIGAEQPLVVRDGECRPCAQEDLVIDDVIVLQPGSQVVVDGQVLSANYLAMDESLLTGESAEVEKKAGVLSGGEKTRLALAMLVVSGANVLLLDEPTNNLDPASRAEILKALQLYEGAIILVTHDEGAVTALDPQRVLLLPDGEEDLWSADYLELISLA